MQVRVKTSTVKKAEILFNDIIDSEKEFPRTKNAEKMLMQSRDTEFVFPASAIHIDTKI